MKLEYQLIGNTKTQKCSKEEPSNSFLEVKIFMEVKTFFSEFFFSFQKFMKFPKTAFGIVLLLICDPNMIAKQALYRSLFNLPKKLFTFMESCLHLWKKLV